jgi:phosphoribosylformylglycinamidine synthase subunit PurS
MAEAHLWCADGGGVMVTARVYITLKPSVVDPQGSIVQHGLTELGFRGVEGVRMGKYVELQLDTTRTKAKKDVEQMCEQLLANPVIETYRFELEAQPARPTQRQKTTR